MKLCKRCDKTKANSAFGLKDRVCKACWAVYKKDQYQNEPRVKQLRAVRMLSPEGRAIDLLGMAKTRARTYKLEFSLTVAPILETLKRGVCPKTGMPFDLSPAKNTRYNPLAPSLDRVDKTGGYTSGNVQTVCNWYNIAKNEFTEDQMLALCRAVVATADRGTK